MIVRYAEVPGWQFEVEEKSAGIYQVVALSDGGLSFDEVGTDENQLLSECKMAALQKNKPH